MFDFVSVELLVAVMLGLRSTGHGVAKPTGSVCVKRICSAIFDELFDINVKFSEGNDFTEVINGYKRFGFLNCGAAIDGTQ